MVDKAVVMIGVPTSIHARRADFYDYLNRMDKPNCVILNPHGSSPAFSRNRIIDCAIETDCTHIMFIDDDMAFPADMLTRLLAHDKDIVTGLYYYKHYVHQPLIFDHFNKKGYAFPIFLHPGMSSLIKIAACGFGCCLVKTSIFKNMQKPYIRLGELDAEQWCDDIGFFWRLKQEKITDDIWCDTTLHVGHMAEVIVWPSRDPDGSWYTLYDTNNPMNGTGNIKVPQTQMESDILAMAGGGKE